MTVPAVQVGGATAHTAEKTPAAAAAAAETLGSYGSGEIDRGGEGERRGLENTWGTGTGLR